MPLSNFAQVHFKSLKLALLQASKLCNAYVARYKMSLIEPSTFNSSSTRI